MNLPTFCREEEPTNHTNTIKVHLEHKNSRFLIQNPITLKSHELYGLFLISNLYNSKSLSENLTGKKTMISYDIPFDEFIDFVKVNATNSNFTKTFLISDSKFLELINKVYPILKHLKQAEENLANPVDNLPLNYGNDSKLNLPTELDNSTLKCFNILYRVFLENCIALQIKLTEFARPLCSETQPPLIIPTLGILSKLVNINNYTYDIDEENKQLKSLNLEYLTNNFPMKFSNLDVGRFKFSISAHFKKLFSVVNMETNYLNSIYDETTIYGANIPKDMLKLSACNELKELDAFTNEFRKRLQEYYGVSPSFVDKKGVESSRKGRFLTYHPNHAYETLVDDLKTKLLDFKQSNPNDTTGEELSKFLTAKDYSILLIYDWISHLKLIRGFNKEIFSIQDTQSSTLTKSKQENETPPPYLVLVGICSEDIDLLT